MRSLNDLHRITLSFAVLVLSLLSAVVHAGQGQVDLALDLPAVTIAAGEDGSAVFSCSGVQWISSTGEPHIPWLVLDVLVPPEAILSSASAQLNHARYERIGGLWTVAPTPPAVTWKNGQEIVIWPENRNILDGWDTVIYSTDASWPRDDVRIVRTGRLRQWKLVKIAVPLIKYNPVTGTLRRLAAGNLALTFNQAAQVLPAGPAQALSYDPVGEKMVRRTAVNYQQQHNAYQSMMPSPDEGIQPVNGQPNPGYVIITTTYTQSGLTRLNDFVAHKQSLGFDVQVVTDVDFGGGTGDTAAENMRNWLINHYLADNIQYVLIIGDPRPSISQVPMKVLQTANTPTDLYYADLTGNWDLDGDGIYGETSGDSGAGGIDTYWEVYVGRIPNYGVVSNIDPILERTIAYDLESATAPAWRRNVLLPMEPLSATFPSYHIGEQIKEDLAIPAGWGYHRIYDEPYDLNPPAETIPCNRDNVLSAWNNGAFGLVSWCTHGSAKAASDVMNLSYASSLNDTYKVFTFQGSCDNAYPETTNNLTLKLLKQGGICTVGATRTAYYSSGERDFAGSASVPGLVYEYSNRIIRLGATSGEALHDMKQALTADSLSWWTNILVYVIYGDPSLRVTPSPIRFVDDDAVAGGDGQSWATAYNDLQTALDEAAGSNGIITEIWVTAGTYKPTQESTPGDPRSVTFQLLNKVRVVGGLAGHENPGVFDLNDRDYIVNETTLSGDLNGDDNTGGDNGENAYHVVTGNNTDHTSILDGFSVSGGNANGTFPNNFGGGISNSGGSPMLINCRIRDNAASSGGGIHNDNGNSTLVACQFTSNSATNYGGGMYNVFSTPTLISCVFHDNQSETQSGGGIYNETNTSAHLTNCTITFNNSDNGGGLGNSPSSSSILLNCIFWSNTDSGGMDESAQINGGSSTVSYSCIQGLDTFTGSNNIGDDPLLDGDGIHLLAGSPCVNAGDPSGDHTNQYDIDAQDRLQHCRVDIGADESGYYVDCNSNSRADACDLQYGSSEDCNNNDVPDDCESDADNDDIIDDCDNCPQAPNTDQANNDNDGQGDECDDDDDNDGVIDTEDNCPFIDNHDQTNSDGDPVGDACDDCPNTIPGLQVDEFGCPPNIPSDLDGDGDVDQMDFGMFQLCLSGAGISPIPECVVADFDVDDDVDQNDVSVFMDCMSGTNIPVEEHCIYYLDNEPPELTAAYSRKWHGNTGEFDIALPLSVQGSIEGKTTNHGLECRSGGPTKIVLVFSEPVQMQSGGSGDIGGIRIYPGVLNDTTVDENRIFLNISNVPDGSCMSITIDGVTDLADNPLTGDKDVHVRVLLGDDTADGMVNIIDLTEIKKCFNGFSINENNCRFDVNTDGTIDDSDLVILQLNMFKSVNTCGWFN